MNGLYDVNREMFFKLDVSGRRGHNMKLFKRRFRLDVRKFVFSNSLIELLIIGMYCHSVVLIVTLLTLLKNISHIIWNWGL